jgi:hypothetical protein
LRLSPLRFLCCILAALILTLVDAVAPKRSLQGTVAQQRYSKAGAERERQRQHRHNRSWPEGLVKPQFLAPSRQFAHRGLAPI